MEIIYLVDTQSIKTQGSDTGYEFSDLAVTTATAEEIRDKDLWWFDLEKVTTLASPRTSDFVMQSTDYYIWSDSDNTLQLIRFEEKRRISATCTRHYAVGQLTTMGEGNPIFICEKVFQSDADFSQVTAMMLYDNVRHRGTGDKCLQAIVQFLGVKI